jgi:glutathione peroxidase-family protein
MSFGFLSPKDFSNIFPIFRLSVYIAQSNDATLVQTSTESVVLIGTYTKCKMPEKGDLLKLLYSSYEDIVI